VVGAAGAVVDLRRGARLAPRILAREPGGLVRAAFVPTQAGPLAGDEDRARIVVGPGAALVVEPVAATLALPGAERTRLTLDVLVHEDGWLVLDEGPLIVAAGADVERRCTLVLAAGAVVALRETVVLGRDGEARGTLRATTRATLAGRPLLHDGLRAGPGGAADHVALAPGHRGVSSACLLGIRPAPSSDAYALAGPGALIRASGVSLAATERAVAARWAAWTDELAQNRTVVTAIRGPSPAGVSR
jgi:urease accessory protein